MKKELGNNDGSPNPKLEKVHGILQKHFCKRPKGRAMVFAEYRDTVEFLTEKLNEYPNIRAERFIGQAGSEGMAQKRQKEILERFGQGEFDTLVSTSIGEEGIDVPSTSLVVFYEPVPSAIRRIQREERTARNGREGDVKVLVMEGTRDEPYYWKSLQEERKMYREASRVKEILEENPDPVQKLRGLRTGEQADLSRGTVEKSRGHLNRSLYLALFPWRSELQRRFPPRPNPVGIGEGSQRLKNRYLNGGERISINLGG